MAVSRSLSHRKKKIHLQDIDAFRTLPDSGFKFQIGQDSGFKICYASGIQMSNHFSEIHFSKWQGFWMQIWNWWVLIWTNTGPIEFIEFHSDIKLMAQPLYSAPCVFFSPWVIPFLLHPQFYNLLEFKSKDGVENLLDHASHFPNTKNIPVASRFLFSPAAHRPQRSQYNSKWQ